MRWASWNVPLLFATLPPLAQDDPRAWAEAVVAEQTAQGLEDIEKKYAGQAFAVVGVHSAKFENERDTEKTRDAVRRCEIRHPVIYDATASWAARRRDEG